MSQIPASACLDIQRLSGLQAKPEPFSPGEEHFWTDAHISKQMLASHLDPDSDGASRRPETIRGEVAWIVKTLGLGPGDSILDMGCGPGLYTARLAAYRLKVTGVDFSENSIQYAEQFARQNGLDISYRCQDYLQLQDESQYDAALLIAGDLCPLSPEQRTRLLSNVRRALKPGGSFVLDVTTPRLRQRQGLKNNWYAASNGFWKPGPHLVLEQGFAYENDLFLDQYTVVEADGKISVYRNWFQDYTGEAIRGELQASGFSVQSLWGDLTGSAYEPTGDWIGIIAKKPE
ncbi:MAG: SAM-dependent methyltransferase [Omnitrophica WOR_2 bacterium]